MRLYLEPSCLCVTMVEVRLGILHGRKVACGCLCAEIEEEVTCGELLDELAYGEGAGLDWSGADRGAWHLVERWNGCGKQSVFSATQPPFLCTRRAQAGR